MTRRDRADATPRFFGEVFVTLFVIMDPPGTIPLFLSLTSGRTPAPAAGAWQAVRRRRSS